MKFSNYLKKIGACPEAINWVGDRTMQQAWDKCIRPDWMLWLVESERLISDCQLRLLAADLAEEVLPIFEKQYPNDDRPRKAICAARLFAVGRIDDDTLNVAWGAARAAVGDAARDAAKAAAKAAAGAAVGNAIGDAAWNAAWDAARAAVGDAIRNATGAAVWNAVGDAIGDAVGDAIRNAARDAVWNAIGEAAWSAAWDATRDAAWDAARSHQCDLIRLVLPNIER